MFSFAGFFCIDKSILLWYNKNNSLNYAVGDTDMIEINGRKLCENCFEEVTGAICKRCGFNSADNSPDPSLLVPGKVLNNRCVIGRVIGKGGFGITYLAYDALVGKKIAVKEYFPHDIVIRTAENPEVSVTSEENAEAFKAGADKFYNEAKMVMRFNGNPNIVSVYDCFYENGTVYMEMEYLRGATLKEHIRDNSTLSPAEAVYVAKNITNALIVTHSASILHRDITPDNVVLCENGDIKLIDFGAARQVVAERTQNFSIILKPGFAPPEQYKKKGNQGTWTDVYSVGATLYYMLTADIPEDPTSRFDNDETFKENLFNIEPSLWEIITKATKLKPEERYPGAYEMKQALDRVPITPKPPIESASTEAADKNSQETGGGNIGMVVSIKASKPRKNFFRRHLRTVIEITCGVLVAAIIIPLAVRVYKLSSAVAPDTSGSVVTAVIGDGVDLDKEGFNKPLYSCLSGNRKTLYGGIYNGIRSGKESIELPGNVFNVEDISVIFDDVLNDNPALNHTHGYNLDFVDDNGNGTPDADESVTAIKPVYTGVQPIAANDIIAADFDGTDMDDKDPIEFLCRIHDKLLNETTLVDRNTKPTSSTTHGVIVEHVADDLGIARAVCDYAQRLGYFSFVNEVNIADTMTLAQVRIRIDDKWYSINPVMDGSLNTGNIIKLPIAEDGKLSHCYFLIGDFFMNMTGLVKYVKDFGDEYSALFPEPDGLHQSSGETYLPTMNYYIEEYLNEHFYLNDGVDTIFNICMEKAKTCLENGEDSFYLYMLAADADNLWDKLQASYVSELKTKYNVSISDFTAEFSGDRIIVTLKK